MYIVCVTLWIKKGMEKKFIEVSRDNHLNTRKEPGNLRFDVLQKEDDPSMFFLYEVYREKEDFARHKQTEHYSRWNEAVSSMQEQPRQSVKYQDIMPASQDENW